MRRVIVALFVLFAFVTSYACNNAVNKSHKPAKVYTDRTIQEEKLATAYFASGCFWCVEAIFQSVRGVKDAISGYSGGKAKNPTYRQISSGLLEHAEAVKVIYDPKEVDFKTLVDVFFGSHDPTTVNRQGPDRGPQYRSIAFYQTNEEKNSIENYIQTAEEKRMFGAPIVTEIKQFDVFWEAEDYHQEYESNHPENPYVQSVSIPRLRAFQAKFPELLKKGAH